MAEGSGERKVRMYRSVSFKRLENWNAKVFGKEGGTELPSKGEVTQPTCHKSHRSPARSLSFSRKVSKISAASKGQTPAHQLSQNFLSQSRDEGSISDNGNSCGECPVNMVCRGDSWQSCPADALPCREQLHQDPLVLTGGDAQSVDVPGSSDDLLSPVYPRALKSSGTLLDDLDSYYSLLNHPDTREVIGIEGSNWPSVTEMRKLFGESSGKAPARTSSLPDCDEWRQAGQPSYLKDSADPQRHCLTETLFNHHTKDQSSHWSKPPSSNETPHCQNLIDNKPDIPNTVFMDTKDHGTNTGPKPQPPTPPPRSCIPFGLRAHTLLPKQESREQSLSLHSLHSSDTLQAAPSNVRHKSSSSEEELLIGSSRWSSTPKKTDFQDLSQEVSSGSEEEKGPLTLRESLREQKIGKDITDGIIAAGCKNVDHDLNHSKGQPPRGNIDNVSKTSSIRHMSAGQTAAHPDVTKQSAATNVPCGVPPETPKPHVRGLSDGLVPQSAGQLSASTPISTVSRVAKVNIPPFLPSPCGSKNSSRYSSTETLKEDEPFSTYCSGPSRSIQGGINIYRSPSFGHSDHLSRQPGLSRSNIAPGILKARSDNVDESSPCDLEIKNAKCTKSMSNPDITSETLSLLNFLKSDLSDLRIGSRGRESVDTDESVSRNENHIGSGGPQTFPSKCRNTVTHSNRSQPGQRPTLKDLTATLRRTKSFTYSEKSGARKIVVQGSMKQSSSELTLASSGDNKVLLLGKEVTEEKDIKREENSTPAVTEDQYVQEARQVFEKISQIGSQDDYVFDEEVSKHLSHLKPLGLQTITSPHSLKDGYAFIDELGREVKKSGEELSGHESCMTDEGIVTEDTPCSANLYPELGKTLTVLKSCDKLHGGICHLSAHNGEVLSTVLPDLENDSPCGVTANINDPQTHLDVPPTSGTVRRRRKFPSLSNNGTDSSSGSSGESGSETYRSLSDPMPHRRYSVTDDPKTFSVDSNLLGSLTSKTGSSESSTIAFSEYTGSNASVLSFSSDGVKDYNMLIQNIVSQPGALHKVIDEKGNGKTIKKKSFSDPSRRGELSPTTFEDSSEPIHELDQPIISSSSEPILSDQREESREIEDREVEVGRIRSQSECVLPREDDDDNGVEGSQNFSFDPKLAEVLSPRTNRRSLKKRTNRIGSQEERSEYDESMEALGKSRGSAKPVRRTSEPTSFIPIVCPETKVSGHPVVQLTIPESAKLPVKPLPSVLGPSVQDVTKRTACYTGDTNTPGTAPNTPTTAEPKILKTIKPHEEVTIGRTKPYVLVKSQKHIFFCSP
ncbi:hypothetical protein GDO86_019727 [Hymenochirus boettgeri]|uniref:Uncharacterized protein n=1 Tax=Hymenochirus boettgeri TaxID=247094 RepID=A0A8T2IIN6_9PIPI|nr:hypothetical protein GDO86_019727 [Hymenochirus boettgeri]KAG8431853.1 hypothetical protein GDO86_019727 [Hymenochirus boettgeri]